ncbi:MAG: NUDIX hydrolase [Sulfurovum sp.]|uniref:NUDIX hydrolase n=1 Tax=Sulfurovum sp. TaxID=1969726 RepID=UPI002867E766|nr:NUDIX hydrolase [Sulfurovum sp.]MCO4846326.1 NUDIX hydrolase [Sulfurovum sp.]
MISDIQLTKCEDSNFVKTQRMRYKQKGIEKAWDMVHVHDSVSVLIYHKQRNAFVLVKQFRPPVFLHNKDGYTYELCAGIVDKDTTLEQITKEEIDEECGYDVPLEKIERVTSFYTAVGFAGAQQTLYYCEVNDEMKIHEGGGVHVEDIEVVYLDIDEAKAFVLDETKAKTPGIMYAMMWWFQQQS